MINELISKLNPASFIRHDRERLRELQAILSSSQSQDKAQQLSAQLTAERISKSPLTVASECIALVSFNHWAEANQATATYLQYFPQDDNMIALLAISLASSGEFDQAQIIINRVLDSIQSKLGLTSQELEQLEPTEQIFPLSMRLAMFRKLSEMIEGHHNPAERIFADQPTLNTGSIHLNNLNNIVSFDMDLGTPDDFNDDTIKEINIKESLALVNSLAEDEDRLIFGDTESVSMELLEGISNQPTATALIQNPTQIIPDQHHDSGERDTEIHAFPSDLDSLEEAAEDRITTILKDIEQREKASSLDHSRLFSDTASNGLPLTTDHLLLESNTALNEYDLLSDYSDYIDPSELGSSVVDSSLFNESTERMRSLSGIMLDEERKRIEKILREEAEPLIVKMGMKSRPQEDLESIADPLLYPPEAASSINLSGQRAEKRPEPREESGAKQSHEEIKLRPDVSLPHNSPPSIPPIPSARAHKVQHAESSLASAPPPIPQVGRLSSDREPKVSSSPPRVRPPSVSEPSFSQTPHHSPQPIKKSAIERLSAGELEIPKTPTPLTPSSPIAPDLMREPTPPSRSKPMWHGGIQRTSRSSQSWWVWLILFLGSYLCLIGAFHYKSAHLTHEVSFIEPSLDWERYAQLEQELSKTIKHPVGRSIDLLQMIIPTSTPLYVRRQSLAHQLAWLSTTRWVLFGEEEQRPQAIESIFMALRRSPQEVGGRAALGLAFYALDQPIAAQAIIKALPKQDWRRDFLFGWIQLQSGQTADAQKNLEETFKKQPQNRLNAHLLAKLNTRKGFSFTQDYLSALKLKLNAPHIQTLYSRRSDVIEGELVTPQLITYLKTLPPRLIREHLDHLLPLLIERDRRVELHNLIRGLEIHEDSEGLLLLPLMIMKLSELDLTSAETLVQKMQLKRSNGDITVNDTLSALALWRVFTHGEFDLKRELSLLKPADFAIKLGHFAGPQLEQLLVDTPAVTDEISHVLETIALLQQGRWVELERISSNLQSSFIGPLDQQLNALSRSLLSANHSSALPAIKRLSKNHSTAITALFTAPELLKGIALSAFDPSRQGSRQLQYLERESTFPAFKWLSYYWRCSILSKSSALGRLDIACRMSTQLNPRDYRSAQSLAQLQFELGHVELAFQTLSKIPKQARSSQSERLLLRLDTKSHYQRPEQESLQSYAELLSAERGLRLNAMNRLIEAQESMLTRQELYRATWVSEYFGEQRTLESLRRRALRLGSPMIRLDLARRRLFLRAAQETDRRGKLSNLLLPKTRVELSSESQLAPFILTFDALKCLAKSETLDLHHLDPAFGQSQPSPKLFKQLSRRSPPRACRQLITDSLSQRNQSQKTTLPLVTLAQAQLLISLGQGERAERSLKALIEREPTMIEARIAYALLLLRSYRSPSLERLQWAFAPLIDLTDQMKSSRVIKEKIRGLEIR